jgi:hypothetical protein
LLVQVVREQGCDRGLADATLLVGEHECLHRGPPSERLESKALRRTAPGRRV